MYYSHTHTTHDTVRTLDIFDFVSLIPYRTSRFLILSPDPGPSSKHASQHSSLTGICPPESGDVSRVSAVKNETQSQTIDLLPFVSPATILAADHTWLYAAGERGAARGELPPAGFSPADFSLCLLRLRASGLLVRIRVRVRVS